MTNQHEYDPIERLLAAAQASVPPLAPVPFGMPTSVVAQYLASKRESDNNRLLFRIILGAFSVSCLCLVIGFASDTSTDPYSSPDSWFQTSSIDQYYDQVAQN